MKVVVKTISGKLMPITIEPEFTIRQIKEQIEKEHSLAADTLKLIAFGKVLDNDARLASEVPLKENDNIVAMIQKAKPVKPAAKPKPEDEKKEEVPNKPAATT